MRDAGLGKARLTAGFRHLHHQSILIVAGSFKVGGSDLVGRSSLPNDHAVGVHSVEFAILVHNSRERFRLTPLYSLGFTIRLNSGEGHPVNFFDGPAGGMYSEYPVFETIAGPDPQSLDPHVSGPGLRFSVCDTDRKKGEHYCGDGCQYFFMS